MRMTTATDVSSLLTGTFRKKRRGKLISIVSPASAAEALYYPSLSYVAVDGQSVLGRAPLWSTSIGEEGACRLGVARNRLRVVGA